MYGHLARFQTTFTTNDKNHVGDEYFLTSGDKMSVLKPQFFPMALTTDFHSRYFLEEDAVDANGNLTREKQKAVNKIGHGELCTISIHRRFKTNVFQRFMSWTLSSVK